MKILYVSEAVLPSDSANSISILHMCMGMAEKHEVTLLGYEGENEKNIYEYYGIDKKDKVNIIRVKRNKNSSVSKIHLLILAMFLSRKCDLIYTRWVQAADVLGRMHNNCVLELHSLLPSRKDKLVARTLRRDTTRKVVFINKSLKKVYERKFLKSERFIVEPGATTIIPKKEKEFVGECGYVGSFYEGKGIEIVCELSKQMEDTKFHIIGGKQEQIEFLKEEYNIGENVIWYGYQPYEKAMKLMDNFDIALLPNQEKVIVGNTDIGKFTSPNKLFEYMAYGKVIVASKVSALEDILVDKENAILVSPTDINEWKKAIYEIKSDYKIREQLIDNSRKQVSTKYNWNCRAERILKGVL